MLLIWKILVIPNPSKYIVGKWQRITGVRSDDCKVKENKSEDKNRLINVL